MKTININTEEKTMNSHRNTARIAGLLFLIGAVTALAMNGLTGGMFTLAITNWAYYVFGVIALSVGVLMYYAVLYRARLIPRWLAFGGLSGAAQALVVAVLVMFGLNPLSPFIISLILPIALQEMVLAGWLIVKGFNPSATASQSAKTATNEPVSTREVRMASSTNA